MHQPAFTCASLCLVLFLAAPAVAQPALPASAASTPKTRSHAHDEHAQHSMTQPMQEARDKTAQAAATLTGAIRVSNAFARPTYGQTKVGAGFVSIENLQKQDDVLLSASSNIAAVTELHTNKTEGDIMRMQKVSNIAIPAGSSVELAPGGMHLMFFRLQQPFTEGMHFTVQLNFAKAGTQEIEFTVKQK